MYGNSGEFEVERELEAECPNDECGVVERMTFVFRHRVGHAVCPACDTLIVKEEN